jgi:hypothetical protein
MLADIKNTRRATHRAVDARHLPRYLGAFAWRFNRRYVPKTIHERLAIAATTTPPMPIPSSNWLRLDGKREPDYNVDDQRHPPQTSGT